MTQGLIGNDLVLTGSATPVAWLGAGDGAVDIGLGSHFRCTPDIPPNGGSSTYVNEFTLVYDVFFPASSNLQWRSLLQTNNNNSNDGDYWVSTSNALGVGAIGYSAETIQPDTWYRIVFSVDIGSNIDGGVPESSFLSVVTDLAGNSWTFRHATQELDGRHSLYSMANDNVVFFFADENGEDNLLRVSRVQLYDESLSEAVAQNLGGPSVPDPNNSPPNPPVLSGGGAGAMTGEVAMFSFTATDPDDDGVGIAVQWGDGSMDSSVFAAAGSVQGFDHSWSVAGDYTVRARSRDEHGAVSDWVDLQVVIVTGASVVTFRTPPGDLTYSGSPIDEANWSRLVITFDLSLAGTDVNAYLDGSLHHTHASNPPVDGRFSLDPFLYFFTDNDGVLTPAEVTSLAGAGNAIPEPSASILLALACCFALRRRR